MRKLLRFLLTVAAAACALAPVASALDIHNITRLGDDSGYAVVSQNGEIVYITKELMQKLIHEEEVWHWTPWLRTRTQVKDSFLKELNCTQESATVNNFPTSIFTDEQLRQGGFICYVLFGTYAFILLATICNDFFIPCVELICEDLKIPQNVAAATFMAVATSCPEFFVNLISTFLTGSDMGIGTIAGSALFNALGVAAIGGLAAAKAIKIDPKPVTRDVLIYLFNVSVLFIIIWDGQVDWYEALVLAILYFGYFILMFNSIRLFGVIDRCVGRLFNKDIYSFDEEDHKNNQVTAEDGIDNHSFNKGSELTVNGVSSQEKLTEKVDEEDHKNNQVTAEDGIDNHSFNKGSELTVNGVSSQEKLTEKDDDKEQPEPRNLWKYPSNQSLIRKLWFLYTWPLNFILSITIPSPITYRKFYPLSFLMCIVWIGGNSYVVTWSMTVIGHTFFIPDSVMGMTFLAFGGCLPEACSIFIMSRKGEGGIGVSNALGANSLAILFALGLPWLIKTLMLVMQGEENSAVLINSAGMDYVIGSLLIAVTCLWLTLFIGKFKLRRRVGILLVFLYVFFISFAVLVETGFIVDLGETTC